MFRWMNIPVLRNGICLLMFLALSWLTVSLPFVARAKKAYTESREKMADENSPLTNTTEEKNPQVNFSEEYLHHEEMTHRTDPSAQSCWHHHPADQLPFPAIDYFSPPPKLS
jgi:hypothetical protein